MVFHVPESCLRPGQYVNLCVVSYPQATLVVLVALVQPVCYQALHYTLESSGVCRVWGPMHPLSLFFIPGAPVVAFGLTLGTGMFQVAYWYDPFLVAGCCIVLAFTSLDFCSY